MTPPYTKCPRCNSPNLIQQTGDAEPTKQYGRLTCGNCKKFITWLQDPALTDCHEQRQKLITTLLTKKLSQRDSEFLSSIQSQRWLTPPQIQWLDSISYRNLGVTSPVQPQSKTRVAV